jgi:hypothetical protein
MATNWCRRTAATVCTVAAVATMTATAPVVHARTATENPSHIVLADGSGDVWKFYMDTEVSRRVRDFPLADVTRMAVTYSTDALRIRMRFVDLRRVGTQLFWHELRIPGYHLQAVLTAKKGHWNGERYFQGDDGSKSCPGFTRKIDYRRNVVRMRLPSTCLHDAPWVEVGAYNELYFREGGPNYFDQPFNHKSPVNTPGQPVRVHRPPL